MVKIKFTRIDYSWRRKSDGKALLFIGIAAAIIGSIFLAWTLSAYSTADSANEWPVAQGKVVQSNVFQSTDDDGTSYYPHVKYNYVVSGVGYSSTRISPFIGGSSDPSYAYGMVAKYQVGQTVAVRYDPSHPEYSVLETKPGPICDIFMIAGLLFFAIGALMMVQGRKWMKTKYEQE